jgi:hypothetical protein
MLLRESQPTAPLLLGSTSGSNLLNQPDAAEHNLLFTLSNPAGGTDLYDVVLTDTTSPVLIAPLVRPNNGFLFSPEASPKEVYYTDDNSGNLFASPILGGSSQSLGFVDGFPTFSSDASILTFRTLVTNPCSVFFCGQSFFGGGSPPFTAFSTGQLFTSNEDGTGPALWDSQANAWQLVENTPGGLAWSAPTLVWNRDVPSGGPYSRYLEVAPIDHSAPPVEVQCLADATTCTTNTSVPPLNYDVTQWQVAQTASGPVLVWISATCTSATCSSTGPYNPVMWTANMDGSGATQIDLGMTSFQIVQDGANTVLLWVAPGDGNVQLKSVTLPQTPASIGTAIHLIVGSTTGLTYQIAPSRQYVLWETGVPAATASAFEAQLVPPGIATLLGVVQCPDGTCNAPAFQFLDSVGLTNQLLMVENPGLNIIDLTTPPDTNNQNLGTQLDGQSLDSPLPLSLSFDAGNGLWRAIYVSGPVTGGASLNAAYLALVPPGGPYPLIPLGANATVSSAAWSPNGQFVAALVQPPSAPTQLWVAAAPVGGAFSADLTNIATAPIQQGPFSPGWFFTPDSQVAFLKQAAAGNFVPYSLELASGAGAVTELATGVLPQGVQVSPDNHNLVFVSSYSLGTGVGTLAYAPLDYATPDVPLQLGTNVGFTADVLGDAYSFNPPGNRIFFMTGTQLTPSGNSFVGELWQAKLDGTAAPFPVLDSADHAVWISATAAYGSRTSSPAPYPFQDGYYFESVP